MIKQNVASKMENVKELFGENSEGLRKLIQDVVQDVLNGEMENFLEAEPYERTENRRGYRAGYYTRRLETRVGTLTPRRSKLHVQSWVEQGQPFYSGAAQCTWEFDGSFTNAALCLPEVYGSVAAKLDGKSLGEEQIFQPFCFSLGKIPAGRHRLELVMHNTLANALECYSAPGGVLAVPRIEEFEE